MGDRLSGRAAGIALQLANWPRRKVRLTELWRLFDDVDPASRTQGQRRALLADTITELAEAGLVRAPSHAAYDRTERPVLPRFLWLPADEAAVPPRPPVVWHPDLSWAADARLPPAHRRALERINRWLHSHRDPLVVPMRERSMEIFGDEKTLDRLPATGLFGPGRLTFDLLRCRRVAPRFVAEPVGSGSGDLLLVVENSDTFDSLVRALRAAPGHRVGSVGWGAGAAFEGSVLSVDPASVSEIRYFGDLDQNGLQVPGNAAVVAEREGLPPLRPAVGLYGALLGLAAPQHGQRMVAPAAASRLAAWLAPEHRAAAATLLAGGHRLAQEAVGIAYLLRNRDWRTDLE